ncbi:MAG: nitrophenyl compound nitroreductase subunit ArsF family protein [Bacteroidales bacterium]|nr:nitrophenyl compound nitroreductase subunit ArsF family protein [Bacteroidales bacterium]MDD4684599.1 nitrophenyl compound nitroreductase subunit ArsF family protein [Bacteroidales bacterium]
MKRITLLVIAMFIGLVSFGQNEKKDLLEIYYFHRTERCLTCNAIEDGVRATLNSYKKEVAKGDLIFQSINIEEDRENQIVKDYEIESPTLLFIYNKKGDRKFVDLTEDAFSYARPNPAKFKKVLKGKINDFFR